MNYTDTNDNELIYMINESNENAYNNLYNKYKKVIFKIASKYKNIANNYGLDMNDLLLEGYVAFDKSIKKFNNINNNTKFYTYMYSYVDNSIKNLIRNNNLKKHSILNNSIDYDDNNIIKNIKDKRRNPYDAIVNSQKNDETYNNILKYLSKTEKEVFTLKYNGYTNKEISKILNKDIKSINNALDRIRRKNKKISNNN